jgi:hypothetical protein
MSRETFDINVAAEEEDSEERRFKNFIFQFPNTQCGNYVVIV